LGAGSTNDEYLGAVMGWHVDYGKDGIEVRGRYTENQERGEMWSRSGLMAQTMNLVRAILNEDSLPLYRWSSDLVYSSTSSAQRNEGKLTLGSVITMLVVASMLIADEEYSTISNRTQSSLESFRLCSVSTKLADLS
jgi:hypothetical protein